MFIINSITNYFINLNNRNALTKTSDFIEAQANSAYNYTVLMEQSQRELENLNYNLTTSNDDYSIKIYEFNSIKSDAESIKKDSSQLRDEIKSKEKMKFTLELNIIVFVSLLSFIGLICKQYSKFIFNLIL